MIAIDINGFINNRYPVLITKRHRYAALSPGSRISLNTRKILIISGLHIAHITASVEDGMLADCAYASVTGFIFIVHSSANRTAATNCNV